VVRHKVVVISRRYILSFLKTLTRRFVPASPIGEVKIKCWRFVPPPVGEAGTKRQVRACKKYINFEKGHPPADFSSLQLRKYEDIQGLQGNGFESLTETSSSDFPLDFPLDLKSGGVKLSLKST